MAHPEAASSESFPIAQLDLIEEIRLLGTSPIPHGHLAKAILHNRDLRIVLMILLRGTQLPRHHAKGSLALQVLDGRAIVTLLESSFDLRSGQMLAIARGVSHAVLAIEDCALLLTVAH